MLEKTYNSIPFFFNMYVIRFSDDLLEKEYLKIRQAGENPPSREEIIEDLKKEVQIKGGFLRVLTRD